MQHGWLDQTSPPPALRVFPTVRGRRRSTTTATACDALWDLSSLRAFQRLRVCVSGQSCAWMTTFILPHSFGHQVSPCLKLLWVKTAPSFLAFSFSILPCCGHQQLWPVLRAWPLFVPYLGRQVPQIRLYLSPTVLIKTFFLKKRPCIRLGIREHTAFVPSPGPMW